MRKYNTKINVLESYIFATIFFGAINIFVQKIKFVYKTFMTENDTIFYLIRILLNLFQHIYVIATLFNFDD